MFNTLNQGTAMASEIRIYKINDFIRKNESGEIDIDRAIRVIRELSAASSFHPDHNILIDLRETKLLYEGMENIMKVVIEFVNLMPSFKNKIASIIPNDSDRVKIAERFEACMTIKEFRFKFFTNFEDAMEWLSDVDA